MITILQNGVPIDGLVFNSGDPVQITIKTSVQLQNLRICALRSDFIEVERNGESESVSLGNGQELIDSGMIEGKQPFDAEFVNISGFDNAYDLMGLSEGGTRDFQLRLNVPAEAVSVGTVGCALGIYYVEVE
jgi:hypothetical protein